MGVKIYPIRMGITRSYILRDRGIVMIGDGIAGRIRNCINYLQISSIKPEEIGLIILTHGHVDHAGAAAGLKELTGAPVAIHLRDKGLIETGTIFMPPGVKAWGKTWHTVLKTFWLPFYRLPAAEADIVVGDEGMSLSEYGVDGKIFHTPGHTPGSVSIVLDSGEAFVGDLALNMFPLTLKPSLALFAEDPVQVHKSWNMLLKLGVKTVYPGHGNPFSADKIRKLLESVDPY